MRRESRELFAVISDCIWSLIVMIMFFIYGYQKFGFVGSILFVAAIMVISIIVCGIGWVAVKLLERIVDKYEPF